MTHYEFERMRSLVDDLCLTYTGWRTPEEHADFLAAHDRIAKRGHEVKQQCEIERLKRRINELEGKS